MLVSTVLLATLSSAPLAPPELDPVQLSHERAPYVAGAGALLLTGGAALFIVGDTQFQARTGRPEAQAEALHFVVGGAALAVLGTCALGISAAMWRGQEPVFAIAPISGGGALAFGGRW